MAFPNRFPGAEENTQAILTWASNVTVPLRAKPHRSARVVGRLQGAKSKRLVFETSYLIVTKPLRLTAKKPIDLRSGRLCQLQNKEVLRCDTPARPKVATGQILRYLHYGSEGSCYVQMVGQVFLVQCPDWSNFSGVGKTVKASAQLQPRAQQWWIKVRSKSTLGWIEVDPKHIRSKLSVH